jgi:hypothetical protein
VPGAWILLICLMQHYAWDLHHCKFYNQFLENLDSEGNELLSQCNVCCQNDTPVTFESEEVFGNFEKENVKCQKITEFSNKDKWLWDLAFLCDLSLWSHRCVTTCICKGAFWIMNVIKLNCLMVNNGLMLLVCAKVELNTKHIISLKQSVASLKTLSVPTRSTWEWTEVVRT